MRILTQADYQEVADIVMSPECKEYYTSDFCEDEKYLKSLFEQLNQPHIVNIIPIPGVFVQWEKTFGNVATASIYALKSARKSSLVHIIKDILKVVFDTFPNIENIVTYVRADNRPSRVFTTLIGGKEAGRLKKVTQKRGQKYDYIIFQITKGGQNE